MIKKIGIILIILLITWVITFVYFTYNQSNKIVIQNNNISVSDNSQNISSVDTANKTINTPLMQTWATINNGSGESITIITNWPTTRSMTPEERSEFQKKIIEKH